MTGILIRPGGAATVNGVQVACTPDAIAAELRRQMPPVSRFQGRMALRRAGLLDAADAAAAQAGGETAIAWDEALEWRRDSPTIHALGAALGLTEAQIDSLFRAAADITV